MNIKRRTHLGEHGAHGVFSINFVSQCPRGESLAPHLGCGMHKSHVWMILVGIVLLYLAFHATPAAARYDCDPFEGGVPQSSKKCPCSDDPNSRYYCASAVQYTVFEITEKVRALFLSILETIARLLWLVARFIANLAEALLRGQIWQTIRQGLLEQLQSVMGGSGGVLSQVAGGGNGLFLVALLLAGLVMVFPLLGASRLVQPDRVILWGVVLFALFIGGTQGFDLTNAVENLRVHIIETIAEGENGDGLIDLVALPVGAAPDEARQLDTNDLMTLPQVMVQDHFIGLPVGSRCQGEGGGVDECQKYRVIAFETNIAGQDLEYMFAAVKYKPDVIDGRQKQYTSGVVRMIVTLLATLVLLLFGMVFALLTAASLVLIIFFVAMLPLGFFEFGSVVLSGLMRQYTSVVGLSLFAAVMVRLMGGVTGTIFGAVSDFSDILGLLTYLGMLLIIGLGLQMAVRTAWGLVDGTFTVLRASVQTVSSMAFAAGGGPLGRTAQATSGAVKAASSKVVNTAMAAGAGLAAGGLSTAFLAGAGGMLSNTKTGRQIADVATATAPASLGAQVFATAVRSAGGWNTAMGIAAVGDRRRSASIGNFREGIHFENARIHPRWGAVDRGSYLTPDLNLLETAEQSYFEHHDPQQTRITLERAFGSRAVADEVLGAYEIQGKAGAQQVRQVIETTQATADDMTRRGRAIFDDRGRLTPACESAILGNLRKARLYNERNPHQSAFIGRLAGATLRRPVEVWDDPQASRKLAWDTFDPERTEVQVNDLPAQVRLRETVQRMGWDEAKLARAFAALPQVRQNTTQEGQPVVEGLLNEWREDEWFKEEDEASLCEVARLVVLIGASAQVQQPHPIPAERDDLIPPVAGLRKNSNCTIAFAPYSADLAQQFIDSLPAQDYHWNAEQSDWEIAPEHEAVARRILEEVAEENGWRVQEIQPAEIQEAGLNHMQSQENPVDVLTTDTPEEQGEPESYTAGTTPSASPGFAEFEDSRGQETAPIPEAVAWQGDEHPREALSESTPLDATSSQGAAPSPEADKGQDRPIADTVPEPTPLESQPEQRPPSTKVVPVLSGHVSPTAAGSTVKTASRQVVEETANSPVPDRSQPAQSPETPQA